MRALHKACALAGALAGALAATFAAPAAAANVAAEIDERLPSLVGFAPPDSDFEIDWSRLLPAEADLRDLSYDPIRRAVIALVKSDEGMTRLVGRVRLMADVPVPNRTLAKGEVIADEDLSVMRLDLLSVHRNVQTGAEGMAGAEARRTLPAGQPILAGDIAVARDVDRNQEIEIVYERNGVTIRTKGRALERGNLGETIKVQPLGGRKTVDARISGPGVVTIGGPG